MMIYTYLYFLMGILNFIDYKMFKDHPKVD